MKRYIFLLAFLLNCISNQAAVLWSQDFSAGATGFFTTSGMTRNAGNTYACVSGNFIYYTSSSNAYVETNTINVGQGKGIRLTFDSRRINASAGNIVVYYLITGACSWDRLNPNDNGWVQWGTITPNTSALSPGGCTSQTLSLESYVCGGQNIAVLMYFSTATATNWISIDNLVVDDVGPVSVAVPNITGVTTYTENFTQNKWYGPVTTGNYATTGITVPYHTWRSASSAYIYLWTGGSGGAGNHSGNAGDYYAALNTGSEFCNSMGPSQFITKELNTSSCAAPQIKYAWRSEYPCGGGTNYSNTFDEGYDLYAPELYTSTGQGYTWVQQSVNYYFPDGLWHFACYSVPSAANIKIRLARGGFCTSPVEGIDNIKVLCRDCSISALSAGTITGEANPLPSTDYVYSITPTSGATYYKWLIRAISRTPPVVIEAACPNGADPCIVSGQGTTSVTINFGTLSENYRVICIPYDANPGTLASPSDACYAALSYFPTSPPLPIELSYFKAVQIEDIIQLQWQTLTETNNDYFSIEKSQDGESFIEIGKIEGAGNSNQTINYFFNIEKLDLGANYFRLKQVDYNGQSSYSEIISVMNESPEESISINYVHGSVIIQSSEDVLYPLTLNLYDLMGRLIFKADNILIVAGETWTSKNYTFLKGIYFIKLDGIGVHLKQQVYLAP
jgi:hypothetical protein